VYRSSSYASQGTKSVFVEISEPSAETARLVQEAGAPEPKSPARRRRSLVHRAASLWDRLLQRMGARTTERRSEVPRQIASPEPRPGYSDT
jgi:NAD-dependent oxidoreductase involved in siderophore biosynthesis